MHSVTLYINPTCTNKIVHRLPVVWGLLRLAPTMYIYIYRRIGLSGAHSLFSTHRLLGAYYLLDKICLDPQQTALIRQKFGVGEAKLQVEHSTNEDHFCK